MFKIFFATQQRNWLLISLRVMGWNSWFLSTDLKVHIEVFGTAGSLDNHSLHVTTHRPGRSGWMISLRIFFLSRCVFFCAEAGIMPVLWSVASVLRSEGHIVLQLKPEMLLFSPCRGSNLPLCLICWYYWWPDFITTVSPGIVDRKISNALCDSVITRQRSIFCLG